MITYITCANLFMSTATFRQLMYLSKNILSEKESISKCSSVKPAVFGFKMSFLKLNSLSTAALEGREVLNLMRVPKRSPACVCRH